MSEEKRKPRLGRELLPEELELVNGGALSDEEIDAYLAQYEDPELRRAWEVAIVVLLNYKGWDYNRYAGIANELAGWLIVHAQIRVGQSELRSILLQAYKKFYIKTFYP